MTTEMKKRIVMTVAGVLLSGFAVGMFNASAFGMDPFQVFAHGTGRLLPVSFGTFYMLLNLLMLVGVFFVDRSKIGLGTFINIFLLGYMVDFSTWVWRQTALVETIALRAVLLAAGVLPAGWLPEEGLLEAVPPPPQAAKARVMDMASAAAISFFIFITVPPLISQKI